MKKILTLALAFGALMTAVAFAQCPADKAEVRGTTPFSAFHKYMAPAWHESYPAKDYDAMIKAADGMEKAFEEIAAIDPQMKNARRKAEFLNSREAFAKELKKYVAFAKAGEKDSVYATLPALHDIFEMTAMAYNPIEYPELSSTMVTTHLIMAKHIPAENWEGIVGSTETLVAKVEALNEKTLPGDLVDQKEALLKEFAAIQKAVADMKACCEKKDLKAYQKLVVELDAKLKDLSALYL